VDNFFENFYLPKTKFKRETAVVKIYFIYLE